MQWVIRMAIPIFALMPLQSYCSASEIILSQSTEDSSQLPYRTHPSKTLVKSILKHGTPDDVLLHRKQLGQCMKRLSLGQQEKLFLSSPLPKAANHAQLYFVRPATKPYCSAFYGSHLFQFWIISESGNIFFNGFGDQVDIHVQQHHGMPDFEITNCNALGCRSVLMVFEDKKYLPMQCRTNAFDEKNQPISTACDPLEYANGY